MCYGAIKVLQTVCSITEAGAQLLNNLGLSFKVTPHTLRHTYATHTLYEMRQRKTQIDPLLYIRDRLGHSSILTTEKYLHYLSHVPFLTISNAVINGSLVNYCSFFKFNYLLFEPFIPRDKNSKICFLNLYCI